MQAFRVLGSSRLSQTCCRGILMRYSPDISIEHLWSTGKCQSKVIKRSLYYLSFVESVKIKGYRRDYASNDKTVTKELKGLY